MYRLEVPFVQDVKTERKRMRTGIPRLPAAEQVPLSPAQQRLFFLHKRDPQNCAYNMPHFFEIEGNLDIDLLHRAFMSLMERHTSLRTTFHLQDGETVQRVAESFHVPMVMADVSGHEESEQQEKLENWVQKELHTPFDLSTGPVFRIGVVKKGPNRHVLLINMHHIISDAGSWAILMREFFALYTAFRDGVEAELPPLSIRYGDYAHWQKERLEQGAFAEAEAYWLNLMAGEWPVPELPLDHPRLEVCQASLCLETLCFDAELGERIQQVCRRSDTTLFVVLLSAASVFLHRLSGVEDLLIGTPVTGRKHVELDGMIGCFANTLPLRIDLHGTPTFCELLERVKKTTLDASVHHEYPFDEIMERFHPVMFSVHRATALPVPTGLQVQHLLPDARRVACNLAISFTERHDGIECRMEYRADLFAGETIRRWMRQMETLLLCLLKNPDQQIGRLQMEKSGEMSSNQV